MKRTALMATAFAAAAQIGLLKASAGGAQDDMELSRAGEHPAIPGPSETFTGYVRVKPLFSPNEQRTTGGAEVSFSPCARTAWHTHQAGQTLIVTSGTGWVQQWGGAKQQISTGDVIWTPAGVKHWHGATAAEGMTHLAIQDSVDGNPVHWCEHVTDEQYLS